MDADNDKVKSAGVIFSYDSKLNQTHHINNNWCTEKETAPSFNGWINNIIGCMRPVFSLISDKSYFVKKTRDDNGKWEIPFDSITELEWLGSGAQGTVFSGKLNGEVIAIKKVRNKQETDIKHLKKLDHINIVKFK